MSEAQAAVIGGSGLYDMEGLESGRVVDLDTPFGRPSAPLTLGRVGEVDVAFLPRHGVGHRLNPTELPSRANIYALKTLGVSRVVSVSAVGSLQESIEPLDLLVPDQLVDRTRVRPSTFFEGGLVAHVGMAEPFCPGLGEVLARAAEGSGARVHRSGTYVVIEGPSFSTRAESRLYRSWGGSVIGMTALPEARLAREAEMCYATLACVTDYDVWREGEADVSTDMVVQNLERNAQRAKATLRHVLPRLSDMPACSCHSALKDAIITRPESISPEVRRRLAPLVGRYVAHSRP